MSRNYQNIEDLGDAIEAIVDQAVNSHDFQRLNQTIRQVVNTAVDTGGEAVRKAADEVAKHSRPTVVNARDEAPYRPRRQYQPNKNIYSSRLGSQRSQQAARKDLPVLYQRTGGKLAGGILKTVGGGILSTVGSVCLLVAGLVTSSLVTAPSIFSAAVLGSGAWLLSSGIRTIGRVNRFDKYVKALGRKTYCDLQQLSRAVGKPQKFVRKELKKMIDEGLFLEGHLDEEESSLITSDDTFVHYLESQQQLAVKKQQQVVQAKQNADAAEEKKRTTEHQEVLDKGNAFLRQICKCNDAIPGVEISEKISRMEQIVQKIFARAESHPEIVPDLKKLMDYYLPMTVKLLNAYADMDAAAVQGETVQNSKQEIEATLDTLNNAFEKLLDSVFKDTALDVSSDITVLQTLLAQEGLTDDGFPQLKKNS